GGGEALPVGAERPRDEPQRSLESEDLLAGGGVPEPHRAAAGGGEAFPVGAERHASDPARMSPEGAMARGELPHPVVPLEATAVDAPRLMLRPLLLEDLPEERDLGVLPVPLSRIHVDEVQAPVGQLSLVTGLPLASPSDLGLLAFLGLSSEGLPLVLPSDLGLL